MNSEEQQLIQREMMHDETLLWSDKPIAKIIRPEVVILAIFGLFFTGFSVFWITSLIFTFGGGFSPMAIMGLLPLSIGFILLSSPLWILQRTKKTLYVITSKRCLIIRYGRSIKTSSYDKRDLSIIDRVEKMDGSGNLIFAKEPYRSRHNNRSTTRYKDVGFYYVGQVRKVESYLSEMLNG